MTVRNAVFELQNINRNLGIANSGLAGINRTHAIQYYVSTSGDNSDGLSWTTAFTSLSGAIAASPDYSDDRLALIMLNGGVYSMTSPGIMTFRKNIEIKGTSRGKTIVTNLHPSASGVIAFESGYVHLEHLMIHQLTNLTGILFNNCTGVNLVSVVLNGQSNTARATSIEVRDSQSIGFNELIILGTSAHTVGLEMRDTINSYVLNSSFLSCLTGTFLTGTTLHNDVECRYVSNGLGFHDCGMCTDTTILDVELLKNTKNFLVNSSNPVINVRIHDHDHPHIYPTGCTGITITTGTPKNTLGSWIEIVPTGMITNPFTIVGLIGSAFDEDGFMHGVELGWGGAGSEHLFM